MSDLGATLPSAPTNEEKPKRRVRPRLAEASRTTASAINDLVAVTRASGHGELADSLVDASKRWPEPQATVVVVGEAGAGRSTVVNALIGRLDPPLLPLGGSLAVVRVGSPEEVRVHTPGQPPRIGTLDAPPEILPTDSVEVVVSSIIAGDQLVLVDAPAAGPAGDPRRRVIDALVATADGVILATRADAPITAPELDLLRAARRRAGAALVVTTRTDRHRGWRSVLEESRATIQAADDRLANVRPLPLAAPLAADAIAARAAGEADAEELGRESGLDPLVAAVRDGITNDLRYLRLLALAELGSDVAEELLEERAGAGEGQPSADDPAAQLAAAQARGRTLRETTSTMLLRLADEFTLLRESVAVEVGREVAAVTTEVNDTLRHDRDIALVADLAAQLFEVSRLALDERTQRRVEAAVRKVLGELDEQMDDAEGASDAEDDESGDDASEPESKRRRRQKRVTASMRLRLAQALLSSTGGVAMLAVVGGTGGGAAETLRFGALGVGMLVGGISAAEGIRETKRQRTSQDAKARLRTVADEWRADYLATARERLLREQRAQEAALRDAIRRQIEESDARVAELQKLIAAGGVRPPEADTTKQLAEIRQRFEELVAQLSP